MLFLKESLFVLSLFLLQILPITLAFNYSTHLFVKLLWIALFLNLFICKTWLRIKFNFKRNRTLTNLLIISSFFFVTQTLSVIMISRESIPNFLNRFDEVIFFYICPFILINYLNKVNSTKFFLIKLIIFGSVINIVVQIIMLFFPIFFSYLLEFTNQSALSSIIFDINRNRINYESYDEAIIPVIVWLLIRKYSKNQQLINIFFFFLLTMIVYFSFVSGYRVRVLVLTMSFIGAVSMILIMLKYQNISDKKVFFLIKMFSFVVFSVLIYGTLFKVNYLSLQRFINPQIQDFQTINSRYENWKLAYLLGSSNLTFGVGLGNIYQYVPNQVKSFKFSHLVDNDYFLKNISDSHNIFLTIFAETGLLALLCFVALFLNFVYYDYIFIREQIFNRHNNLRSEEFFFTFAFIISFWVLSIYSLITPIFTIKYITYFWLLRIIIYFNYEMIISDKVNE